MHDWSSWELRRIRICLSVFIAGLFVSGVTAFPLETELAAILRLLHRTPLQDPARALHLLPWLTQVHNALAQTNAHYPFLSYGTDWLAFAHLAFAVLFLGPFVDPVRNRWVTLFGIIACAGIPVLAFVAGSIRGILVGWRLIDTSFGVFGAIPPMVALRCTRRLQVFSHHADA